MGTGTIIALIIAAVVLAVAVVLGIKYREKIKKFLRVYKSELKKVVWMPWDQTKKSTLVVLVVMIACAVTISLLDWGLGEGFLSFIRLFK